MGVRGLSRRGFAGRGVAGRDVQCLTPEAQVLVHDGYVLGERDYRELRLLHDRFGVELPRVRVALVSLSEWIARFAKS
jgi:hypothetical protein